MFTRIREFKEVPIVKSRDFLKSIGGENGVTLITLTLE
jgi:hypothetical protein